MGVNSYKLTFLLVSIYDITLNNLSMSLKTSVLGDFFISTCYK